MALTLRPTDGDLARCDPARAMMILRLLGQGQSTTDRTFGYRCSLAATGSLTCRTVNDPVIRISRVHITPANTDSSDQSRVAPMEREHYRLLST